MTLPSRTLLVQGLPSGHTAETLSAMLKGLFGQYAGLTEVRTVPQRGLAFVEFSSEAAASPALQGLHNFKLSATESITVTYART